MRRLVRQVAAVAGLLVLGAVPSRAQEPEVAAPMVVNREMAGRVVHAERDTIVPVPGMAVTLHRVGPEGGHPIDSARTAAGGRYHFRYKATGSDDAVYFVSATWDGITYFSTPTRNPEVAPGEGDITVFDTTSVPFPIRPLGHHLVIAAPRPDGTREIAEVYEIGNDTSVTLLAKPGGTTFTAHLPEGATAPHVTQGDIAPATVQFVNGELRVDAPISPGARQVAFEYTLPAKSFPLTMPLEQPTGTLEVLVEEQGTRVTAPGIQRVAAVSLQGRNFVRYLAQDVPGSAVLEVVPPEAEGANRGKWFAALAVVAALAMMAALWVALGRRRGAAERSAAAAAPGGEPAPDSTESLVRQIALLDAEYERSAKAPEETESYERRRTALKAELTAKLAAERRAG